MCSALVALCWDTLRPVGYFEGEGCVGTDKQLVGGIESKLKKRCFPLGCVILGKGACAGTRIDPLRTDESRLVLAGVPEKH